MNASHDSAQDLSLSVLEETPFCQIVGRDIPCSQCFEMQGQTGCFGCAAITRFCEVCKTKQVDVPAVGMCSDCLVQALAEESSKPDIHHTTRVQCQVFKKKISTEMCLATQGQEGCRNCSAHSRLCEKCKQRPSRFAQYGLCLHCTVAEYGEGWEPGIPTRIIVKPLEVEDDETSAELDNQIPADVSSHMPLARFLILKHQRASTVFLSDRLNIRKEIIRKILVQCEKEGLVGPKQGSAKARTVLLPTPTNEELAKLASEAGMCGTCFDRPIKSKGLCNRCSVAMYRALKGTRTGPNDGKVVFVGMPNVDKVNILSIPQLLLDNQQEQGLTRIQKIAKLQEFLEIWGECELTTVVRSAIEDLRTLDLIELLAKRLNNHS